MANEVIVEEDPTDSANTCKDLCQAKWETCTAYQYNESDNTCMTFTENITMMGDSDILFDCYVTKDLALT